MAETTYAFEKCNTESVWEKAAYNSESLSDFDLISMLTGVKVAKAFSDTEANIVLKEKERAQLNALKTLKKRWVEKTNIAISSPSDVYSIIRHFAYEADQELFIVVCLDGAHTVKAVEVVTKGLVNRTLVHAREVFAPAIEKRAAAIIVAHNHPSGNITPSVEDMNETTRLHECGELLGIKVLDHLIISPLDYYSFREHGKI